MIGGARKSALNTSELGIGGKSRRSSLSRVVYATLMVFTLAVITVLGIALIAVAVWEYGHDGEALADFLASSALPVVLVLAFVAALAFPFSRLVARRVMRPIDAIDLSKPLENEAYEEMGPLLRRIDEQQRQLKTQNEELALAESMRRDFSANVSHEMKTPLQVISGYSELLKNNLVQPEDQQRFAGLIYDEAQSMRKLIDDVLTLSRLDETAFAASNVPVDVVAVAERMVGRLAVFADERGVRLHVRGENALVVGSEALLEEMLHNLIENGIRYNRDGGSVTITVSAVDGDAGNASLWAPNILDEAREPGADCRWAVVRVADTGMGIAPEHHEKVFERFFRVEKSRSKETGGTGLGLAIVKHAAAYHGGFVSLESELGKGTTFVVALPAR